MDSLHQFTFFFNYIAFIFTLWLGIYLVTRNPRYPLSWLTALTLWSLATSFLHYLLEPSFWSASTVDFSTSRLFQGMAVAPALAFWHHATILTRPRRMNAWRLGRILAAYLIAIAAVVIQAVKPFWTRTPGGDLLYLNTRQAGPLYSFFGAALVLFIIASMINLFRSARASPAPLLRKQLQFLAWATLVAGLSAPAIIVAIVLKWPVPTTAVSILLATMVFLIGFGVARYSALTQGRTIHRDFFYNLAMVSLIEAIYIPVSWVLLEGFQARAAILILIPCLVILTHSLVNPAYRLVDTLLIKRGTKQMRSDLRQLRRVSFEGDSLATNLAPALADLCRSINASFGMVLTFENEHCKPIAEYRWIGQPIDISLKLLRSDDVLHVNPGQLPEPLQEVSLLVPLYKDNEQFGALLLGHPKNGLRYAEEDVERVLNPAEVIGEAIHMSSLREELMLKLSQLARTKLAAFETIPQEGVEEALRNLHDYAFLADSILAELGLVQSRLPYGSVTHIDRGKVVHDVLLESLNKLKPGTEVLRDPPPREWYPFLILKEAYLDGVSNRDIMMHLYISEGTFNRTRRAAIRAVRRMLEEMENNLR